VTDCQPTLCPDCGEELIHRQDDDVAAVERVVAILVKHSSRSARREIIRVLDALDQEDTAMDDQNDHPRYPDESEDEPDRSAPVGDRMYVPQPLLDLDGKDVTFSGIDPETGAVVEGTAPLVVAPEAFKEAARRRGVDVDA
jgi:hypothetical protein